MTSTTRRRLMVAFAFTGSFLAVGLPYWQIPYAEVSLPDAVWNPALVAVAALAALARVAAGAGFRSSTLIFGASVPAAVMAKVICDGISDPTSHNLWPFEVILASGPGLVAGFAGALAGSLLIALGVTAVRPGVRHEHR